MELSEILNRKLAIVAWKTGEDGNREVAVFTGIVKMFDSTYFLDRGEGEPLFEIFDDWLPRIKSVSDDISDILMGAEYHLSLSVGDADDEGPFKETGLKWPD